MSMLPFFLALYVWSPHTHDPDPWRWGETHTVPKPPTWGHMSPQSGHHGCGRWAPKVNKPGPWGLWDPRKKCTDHLLSPQLSLRNQAPPVFTSVLCDFLLVWKLMLEVNTLPWFWQALSFLSRCGAEKTGELGWKTRGSSVPFRGESRLEEITAATSPAAHWHFARSLCPGINSPGEPASLLNLNVLEHWNNY